MKQSYQNMVTGVSNCSNQLEDQDIESYESLMNDLYIIHERLRRFNDRRVLSIIKTQQARVGPSRSLIEIRVVLEEAKELLLTYSAAATHSN